MRPATLPAILSACAVALAGAVALPFVALPPLSLHMVLHILLMNLAAPLLAVAIARAGPDRHAGSKLWAAALVQVLLLWAWHAPSAQRMLTHSDALQIAAHAALLVAAVCFWTFLMRLPVRRCWHGVGALLLTGKLTCLLAALLVFAPRLLYAAADAGHAGHITHADQQLAGLLMITACPLSYVVAGVALAAQALGLLRAPGAAGARTIASTR